MKTKWTALLAPWVKVNWDADIYTKNQKMGLGVVVRDHMGVFLAGLSTSAGFAFQPIIVEFLALWRAMELCHELGFDKVQLDGDVKTLINAINNPEECCTWYETLVVDAKHVLRNRDTW